MSRIIIVDDDPQFYAFMAAFLRAQGHHVNLATDPTQLYVVIRDLRPDLVILDTQMPEGGGPMAVRVLQENLDYRVPLLICSGMPVAHLKSWYPDGPDRRYLTKPVELDWVQRYVRELLAVPTGG